MALSTNRVCLPCRGKKLCPPRRVLCPSGCNPGQCLNGQCPNRMRAEILYGNPDAEQEMHVQKKCIEQALKEKRRKERLEYLAEQRKLMGINEFEAEEKSRLLQFRSRTSDDNEGAKNVLRCPPIDPKWLKDTESRKTMRTPARPLCMLEVPHYSPPSDDYTELSRFLRISTMPGYSNSDTISEYKDNHNMAVWNDRKDIDAQSNKMKRDWLSVWGEFNVKEQRWRKAWVEKFGSENTAVLKKT